MTTPRAASDRQERGTAVTATDRGLSLLRVVAEHPEGITLSDGARAVELAPSTALRHLRSLEAAGFVVRRDDARFEPGPELLRIARSLAAHAALPRLAQPVLDDLAVACGESAYLAEPSDAHRAVYTAIAEGHHTIRHVTWLGRAVARRGSAVGAALGGRVDTDGVAVREDAVEAGVTAVSAPVRRAGAKIVAAVSVVGPSFRLSGPRLAAARSAVAVAAARLSEP